MQVSTNVSERIIHCGRRKKCLTSGNGAQQLADRIEATFQRESRDVDGGGYWSKTGSLVGTEDDEDVAEILAEAPCPPLCCDEQEATIPHPPMLGVNES
jgi:hypothetical protein